MSWSEAQSSSEPNDPFRLIISVGPEHAATTTNPTQPSYCTLPLFHPSQNATQKVNLGCVTWLCLRYKCNTDFDIIQLCFQRWTSICLQKSCDHATSISCVRSISPDDFVQDFWLFCFLRIFVIDRQAHFYRQIVCVNNNLQLNLAAGLDPWLRVIDSHFQVLQ